MTQSENKFPAVKQHKAGPNGRAL